MCLISSYKEPKVAKKPITCYKVLIKDNSFCAKILGDYSYMTPYRRYPVEDGIIDGKINMIARGDNYVNEIYDNTGEKAMYAISGGYIHCYSDLNKASDDPWGSTDGFVFECEIPAGVEYYTGLNKKICAKEIKFIKKIDLC